MNFKKRIKELKESGHTINQAVDILKKENVLTPMGSEANSYNVSYHWCRVNKRKSRKPRADRGVPRKANGVAKRTEITKRSTYKFENQNIVLDSIQIILKTNIEDNSKIEIIRGMLV